MHIILHALSLIVVIQFVTVMNVNYKPSKLGDRSKREHSTLKQNNYKTAKISGNALKQGGRAHSVALQRSSQLQNQWRSQNEAEQAMPLQNQTF